VKEISVGTDGSVWALSCEKNAESTDY